MMSGAEGSVVNFKEARRIAKQTQIRIRSALSGYIGSANTEQMMAEMRALIAKELGILVDEIAPKMELFINVRRGNEPSTIEYDIVPANKMTHLLLERYEVQHLWSRYEHDCDECVFLGIHKEYDLYFCAQIILTVIARYSGEGSEYLSGLSFADKSEPLRRAKEFAEKRGLLEKE